MLLALVNKTLLLYLFDLVIILVTLKLVKDHTMILLSYLFLTLCLGPIWGLLFTCGWILNLNQEYLPILTNHLLEGMWKLLELIGINLLIAIDYLHLTLLSLVLISILFLLLFSRFENMICNIYMFDTWARVLVHCLVVLRRALINLMGA